MPKLNSKECLSELKKLEGINQIPVSTYSTSNLREDKEVTKKLSASRFIHKPTNFGVLCQETSLAFSIIKD
ncbi:MAG: hypothetical protein ACKVOM_07070 [Ferruginibacter sp.]